MSDEESFKVTDRRGRAAGPSGTGPSSRPPAQQTEEGQAEPTPAADLAGLVMMLTSSALVSLGAVSEPGSDQPRVDLPQARAMIDTLLMLRQKTEGNRTEPESRLLDEILYDLQMRFLRVARP